MRKLVVLFCLLIAFGLNVSAQRENDSPFKRLEVINVLQRPPQIHYKSSQIKNIQTFGKLSGIAYTSDTLFLTDDNGENWREIIFPKRYSQTIGNAEFIDENNAAIILADERNANLQLLKSVDGGINWVVNAINLRAEDFSAIDLQNMSLTFENNFRGQILLKLRLQTSSNFSGQVFYESFDGGNSWQFISRDVVPRKTDNVRVKRSNRWTLENIGDCVNGKIGCVNESKIVRNNLEITPPQIKNLAQIEKSKTETTQNSIFPPNGSTRTTRT